MSFYNNQHFENIKNTLIDKYMFQAQRNNLTNTKTYNLTGGSIRRQYEYIPQSFILSKENEGKKRILSGKNVDYSGSRGYNSLTVGGNLWSEIGKFAKPVASAALDVAAPMAGMYLGGPIGATLAKGAREGVRAVTGFGKGRKKTKEIVGVGVYSGGAISGGCNGDIACLPCKKKMKGSAKSAGAKSAGAKTAGARSGGKKGNRMDLVKKIMKEKGYNLGQASKFIKENGLY